MPIDPTPDHVPKEASPPGDAAPDQWAWVERSVWTDRMLESLERGVRGGKWFALIDKVYRPSTLAAAWQRVKANKGAAGADFQSIAAFAEREEHELMGDVREHVTDGRVLGLIECFLEQEVLEDLERWTPQQGTPQGAVISPLLANLYLHKVDVGVAEAGHEMVRYADDFVILCKSRDEAESALELARKLTEARGLILHPDKTEVVSAAARGEGFDFLGYHFECGQRWPSAKSVGKLKDVIRAKTSPKSGRSMRCIIADANRTLRGWYEYFKHSTKGRSFDNLDGMIRRRLRTILHRRRKKRGISPLWDNRRWTNAYFRDLGYFSLEDAHRSNLQSARG